MTYKEYLIKLYFTIKERLEQLSADNPIELALGVFFAAFLLVVALSYSFYGSDFYQNVLVEAHGMLLDLLIIGVFVYWLDTLGDRKRAIRKYQEEIDDYLDWQSHEATYRIIGNIRRLNREKIYEIHLQNAFLPQANLLKIVLEGSNLQNASLQEANLQQARLRNSDLRGANMRGANLNKANLTGAKLQSASQWESTALEIFLHDASSRLKVTDLQGANLREAILSKANMRGTDLQGGDLWGANLKEANLHRANLRGASLWEADLQRTELENANLQRTNFRNANLWRANLEDAQLQHARLQGTNLQNANMKGANLHKARLQEADVRQADLQRANLYGANFRRANLEETNLTGARYNWQTRWPDNFDPQRAGAIFEEDNPTTTPNGRVSSSVWSAFE